MEYFVDEEISDLEKDIIKKIDKKHKEDLEKDERLEKAFKECSVIECRGYENIEGCGKCFYNDVQLKHYYRFSPTTDRVSSYYVIACPYCGITYNATLTKHCGFINKLFKYLKKLWNKN